MGVAAGQQDKAGFGQAYLLPERPVPGIDTLLARPFVTVAGLFPVVKRALLLRGGAPLARILGFHALDGRHEIWNPHARPLVWKW